jgi:predicted NUDIX family NTP pyrophosphohydrolase
MAKKTSAGLLLYRRHAELEVFLVHPGGPFWAKKDAGAWSLPKGEIGEGEDPLEAAKREFTEETGLSIDGKFLPLDPVKQSGGKVVYAWAIEADSDPSQIRSNLFLLEWPQNPDERSSSRKSITPHGSIFPRHGSESFRAKSVFSRSSLRFSAS